MVKEFLQKTFRFVLDILHSFGHVNTVVVVTHPVLTSTYLYPPRNKGKDCRFVGVVIASIVYSMIVADTCFH